MDDGFRKSKIIENPQCNRGPGVNESRETMKFFFPALITFSKLTSTITSASEQCSVDLAVRQGWASAIREAFQSTKTVREGAIVFAPAGSISNPSGSYGALRFPDGDMLDQESCDCLEGTTCTQLFPPKKSSTTAESTCESTFLPSINDAVITIACLPPNEIDYFSYQTNLFSRAMKVNEDDDAKSVYFPEVSPLRAINQIDLSNRWGQPFVIITSLSKSLTDDIVAVLINMDDNLTIVRDGLGSDSINVASDSLQVILRLNHEDFTDADLLQYIDDSASEQIAIYLQGQGNNESGSVVDTTVEVSSPLKERKDETYDLYETYSALMDNLEDSIVAKMSDSGYTLSFSAELSPAMNFGYSNTDTDECCIGGYFNNTEYWRPIIHFSTNDCLYTGAGVTMSLGGDDLVIGNVLSVDYSAIGEGMNITTHNAFTCDDDNNLNILYNCREGCEESSCGIAPMPSQCTQVGDSPIFYKISCGDDGALSTLYSDEGCEKVLKVGGNLEGVCNNSTKSVEGEAWAGGHLRDGGVAIALGVNTNLLGRSNFHNIYLPQFNTYTDLTVEKFNFNEKTLSGSGVEWGGEGFEDLFVAVFGRECAGASEDFCKVVSTDLLSVKDGFSLLSRQYLDLTTGVGMDKDLLPGGRYLMFDKSVLV